MKLTEYLKTSLEPFNKYDDFWILTNSEFEIDLPCVIILPYDPNYDFIYCALSYLSEILNEKEREIIAIYKEEDLKVG